MCKRLTLILFVMLLGTAFSAAFAQNDTRHISGKVTDENGEPLVGAAVIVPGTPYGTVADIDGNFSLQVPLNCESMQVSLIGMKTMTVDVAGKNTVEIALKNDNSLLDEVIVTGYQTLSKERSTGAFSKVTSDQLQTKRLGNLGTVLEGEIAGMHDGIVRGTTTMNGTTQPLYVIDGFPVENTGMDYYGGLEEALPNLNMEDIESVTVLKDAAAASIYGARAANGVVVITTKKRATGNRVNVSLSATLTFSPNKLYSSHLASAADIVGLEKEWAANNPNLQGEGAKDYALSTLNNAIYPSAGIQSILNYHAGKISQSQMDETLSNLAKKGHNYFDQVQKYGRRAAFYQQYNLSILKSSDRNDFKASVTYKRNKEHDIYTDNNDFGLQLNNTTQIAKWLSLDLGAYINYGNQNLQNYDLLSPGYTALPYDDLVNADGSPYTRPMNLLLPDYSIATIEQYGLQKMHITPLEEAANQQVNNKSIGVRTYARINLKFTDWLKYSASFQYERNNNRYEQLYDKDTYYARSVVNAKSVLDSSGNIKQYIPVGNILNQRDQYMTAYNFRHQLDFDKTFAGVHNVTAILGNEVRDTKVEMHRTLQFGYDPQLLSSTPIDAATMVNTYGMVGSNYMQANDIYASYENVNRFVSFYGNAAYTFDSRYSVTGSLRWDRSNLWGTSSKYQNKPIWSVGAAWIISNEKFFNASWVDHLKLRFSYGVGGNIAKDSAPYMVASYYPNVNVGGQYGSVTTRPNSQLSWEKTTTANVGIDFAFLHNRLNGSVEFYNKDGRDLLANTMGVPTEGFGYNTYSINNGEMYNRGVEIALDGVIIKTRDWHWSAKATFAYNANKITYVNVKAPMYILQLDYPEAYPQIGNPYHAIYGYNWAGLSSEGLPQVYNEKGEKVTDKPTTLDAMLCLGTTVPKFSGSFSTSLSWRNFDLNVQFLFAGGHVMRNANSPILQCGYTAIGYATTISNVSCDIANRWQKPGDEANTNVPKVVFAESDYSAESLASTYNYSSINILKGDYLKIGNISLAYRLPRSICRKAYMQSARIQFNVENPCLWAKSKQAKYQLGGFNPANYVIGVYVNF